MDIPVRKLQRLKNYDYSQDNAYFITICTHNRMDLFGDVINANMVLSNAGRMVFGRFADIPLHYPDIVIDKFVVMPNHLHAILGIRRGGAAQGPLPTTTMNLPDYVHRFKSLTTRLYIEGVRNGA